MRAGKLGALKLMRSSSIGDRVLALQRLVFEDPTLERVPPPGQYRKAIAEIEDALADIVAQRTVEDEVERARQREDGAPPRRVRPRSQARSAARSGRPRDAGDAAPARGSARSRRTAAQRDRARRAAAQDVSPGSSVRRPRSQALLAKLDLAVSAARDPLRAAGRRQDDGRAAGARAGQDARAHAVRRRRAVRRGQRHDAALGSSRDDEPAARQRPRSDLSGQPARLGRERDPRAEAGPRDAKRTAACCSSTRSARWRRRCRRSCSRCSKTSACTFESSYYDEHDPERAGVREEALRRRRAGRFHPDRRDDARSRGDRSGDPLALRGGLLRAADPSPDRAIVQEATRRLGARTAKTVPALIATYTNEGRKAVQILADAYGHALFRRARADAPASATRT